ncbi:MAG: TonB-dependent receptor [Acidobacteriota bacterium]|nr:TonB-dependent receptor [Acidobacteriota bacterium]
MGKRSKVSEAKTIEGSVGGTINLRTIRPLDLKRPLIALRVQGEYSDLSKTTQPRVSGTVGNRWQTGIGEVGIVLSGSYSKSDVSAFLPRADRDNLNLPGQFADSKSFPFLQLQFLQQEVNNYHYDTRTGTGTLEWKPAHNLKFYFDATLNNQQRAQDSYRLQVGSIAVPAVYNGTNVASFQTVDLGSLIGPNGTTDLGSVQSVQTGTTPVGGTGNAVLRSSTDTGARLTHNRVFDLGTEWQGERLTVAAEAALSTAKTNSPNFSTVMNFINPNAPQPVYRDGTVGNGIPTMFDLTNSLAFGINSADPKAPTSAQLLDPKNYRLYSLTNGGTTADNQEKAARLDFTYDTTDIAPFLKSVQFGYRWNQNTAITTTTTGSTTFSNNSATAANNFNAPTGNLFSGILETGPTNFNSADGRSLYIRDFLLISATQSFKDPVGTLAALNSAIAAQNALNPGQTPLKLLGPPVDSAAGYYSIKETTSAAYFQANMDTDIFGIRARGNIGLRWLKTRLTSIGNNVGTGGVVTGTLTNTSNYTFLLPRASLVLEPSSKVLIRAGVARDIRRPNFDALSTSYAFSTAATANVNGGNPDLVPEVVWSFDLSGEYYFAPSSLFSVGVFRKNRTNLFADTVNYPPQLASSPVGGAYYSIDPTCPGGGIYNPIANRNIYSATPGNGICAPLASKFNVPGTTTQSGVEIGLQYSLAQWENKIGFLSGLGFIGNFTYQVAGGNANAYYTGLTTRNLDTGLGFPAGSLKSKIGLVNLSKYAYNATVFYDKYGLNARVRYTWRSSYVVDQATQAFRWNLPLVAGARGQLNASINYDITRNINFGIEAINLTRADQKLYCVSESALLCFQGLSDRRVTAGVSVKF